MSTTVTPVARNMFLELQADMSLAERNRLAVQDVTEGAQLWQLAAKLGWLDIRLRYRGSVLGPFWLTLSTGIMVGALGVLYSIAVPHQSARVSAVPLAVAGAVGFPVHPGQRSLHHFTDAEAMIRSVRMPFFVFAMRTMLRNLLVLAHNLVVIVVVYAVLLIWPGWHALIAIPGLVIWTVDALALALLLGAFCARFRDIQPIVNSVMQIAFFVTPVIWTAGAAGRRRGVPAAQPVLSICWRSCARRCWDPRRMR